MFLIFKKMLFYPLSLNVCKFLIVGEQGGGGEGESTAPILQFFSKLSPIKTNASTPMCYPHPPLKNEASHSIYLKNKLPY